MRILISGGTGFVGRALVAHLIGRGRQVSVLSRSGRADYSPGPVPEMVIGDPGREGQWQTAASGADVVVNLAGASIFNRWTKTVKKRTGKQPGQHHPEHRPGHDPGPKTGPNPAQRLGRGLLRISR